MVPQSTYTYERVDSKLYSSSKNIPFVPSKTAYVRLLTHAHKYLACQSVQVPLKY